MFPIRRAFLYSCYFCWMLAIVAQRFIQAMPFRPTPSSTIATYSSLPPEIHAHITEHLSELDLDALGKTNTHQRNAALETLQERHREWMYMHGMQTTYEAFLRLLQVSREQKRALSVDQLRFTVEAYGRPSDAQMDRLIVIAGHGESMAAYRYFCQLRGEAGNHGVVPEQVHQLALDERRFHALVYNLQRRVSVVEEDVQEFALSPWESLVIDYRDPSMQGISLLHIAAHYGNIPATRALLQADAYPDFSTQQGRTPLQNAAKHGHADVVRLLLHHGANANGRNPLTGATPLLLAVQFGHVDVVRALLEAGVDVEFSDHGNRTPLLLAVLKGREVIATLLLQANAKPDVTDNQRRTPLTIAAEKGATELVWKLIQHGANPDWDPAQGRSALMLATLGGHLATVKVLLMHEVNTNVCDEDGWRPLHVAARLGDYEMVNALLDGGANVNMSQSWTWKTPLIVAVEHKQCDIVRLLVRRGADLQRIDKQRRTAWDYATLPSLRIALKQGS